MTVSEIGPVGARETGEAGRAARRLVAKAARENVPVAPRFLPRVWRADLLAVYGYARLVDDIGDGDLPHAATHARLLGLSGPAATDPLPLLDAVEADLRRAVATAHGDPSAAAPRHPLVGALVPTVRRVGLTAEPFLRLVEANRLDQRRHRYASHDQLLDYCALSAHPVGRLVLAVTDTATPERLRHSDAVCTALQLLEHLQDVPEDLARGRIYLPATDLRRFRVTPADLAAPTANASVRALVAHLTRWARALLAAGTGLLAGVHGRPRLLLAGFVGGGLATARAVAAAGYDVLSGPPRPTRRGLLWATALTAARRAGPR